jgi:hypothetical protein
MDGFALWANRTYFGIAIIRNAVLDRCAALFAVFDGGGRHKSDL